MKVIRLIPRDIQKMMAKIYEELSEYLNDTRKAERKNK